MAAEVQDNSQDYFSAIQPSSQGYLHWPQLPVQIYVEPIGEPALARERRWRDSVQGAIADWSPYIALTATEARQQANIRILRSAPPLTWSPNGPRARNAETRFRIFSGTTHDGDSCFWHQQTIFLGDRQAPDLLRGTARHELGHALGLWGHSPDPNDALYVQQVGSPPPISQRDLNTLQRLYRQPSQLHCPDSTPGNSHGS